MLEKIYDGTGVFESFEQISQIPRGSGHNTKISEFLLKFAKEHNIQVWQDQAENIVMVKEASAGMESLPTIMLQGHMDMVCEKNAGCEHDFLTEGLELSIDHDWIQAKGTTLGADDGIAIAYIMALFTDKTLCHPRLEAVITVDEEIGMDGAYALDMSKLQAKYLLNLDSEEEGIFLTSCAGGLTLAGTIPIVRETAEGILLKLSIHGLKGGHSGAEIDKNRTNAVLLLGRLLHDLQELGNRDEKAQSQEKSSNRNEKTQNQDKSGKDHENIVFRLVEVKGGNKDNAIPCEAYAEILLKTEKEGISEQVSEQVSKQISEQISEQILKLTESYQKELSASEPDLCIEFEIVEHSTKAVLNDESTKRILDLLYLSSSGVMVMSERMPGLVESSQNLGIFHLKEKDAKVRFSIRSSVVSAKYYLAEKCKCLIELCGGTCETSSEYPAWEYREESKLREYIAEVYEKEYGKKPVFHAIHAGLECGLFYEKMPGLDIISFGPNIEDIHTPKERMSISSAKRVYGFVKNLLEGWKI